MKLLYSSIVTFVASLILFIVAAKVGWRIGIFGVGAIIQISLLLTLVTLVLSGINIIKKFRTGSSAIVLILSLVFGIIMILYVQWHYEKKHRESAFLNIIFTLLRGWETDANSSPPQIAPDNS